LQGLACEFTSRAGMTLQECSSARACSPGTLQVHPAQGSGVLVPWPAKFCAAASRKSRSSSLTTIIHSHCPSLTFQGPLGLLPLHPECFSYLSLAESQPYPSDAQVSRKCLPIASSYHDVNRWLAATFVSISTSYFPPFLLTASHGAVSGTNCLPSNRCAMCCT
jgi:hypothetical protein